MTLNFPDSPTVGDVYNASTWDGEKWALGGSGGGGSGTLDPDLVAIAALSGTGLAKRTAPDTWALVPEGSGDFIQAGAGAVTRTMQDKARDIVSVKDFGATGDSVTDDAPAIQAALDHLATGHAGGVLYIPKGRYVLGNGLTVANSIQLLGDGYMGDGATLLINATTNEAAVTCGNLLAQSVGYKISNINFVQQSGVTPVAGNCGLHIMNCLDAHIEDVGFNPYPAALYDGLKLTDVCVSTRVRGVLAHQCLNHGMVIKDALDIAVHHCRFDVNGASGIHISGTNGVYFDSVTSLGNTFHGVHIAAPTGNPLNANMFFTKCIADGNGSANWLIEDLAVSTFSQCWGCTQKDPAVNTFATGFWLATGGEMSNIEFIGCIAGLNNSHGMYIAAGRNISIQGGIFGNQWSGDVSGVPTAFDHGNGRAIVGSGIKIASTATSVEINNVLCSYNSGHGITIDGPGNTRITGGIMEANDSGVINGPGNAIRISGVKGFNPRGGTIAPAIPASGVAAPNNTGVDVMVSIIGGTVSAIYVGSDYVANETPATGIYLPAGQDIILIYTDAPLLWQWYGM